mgnify:CR=1 FL=1
MAEIAFNAVGVTRREPGALGGRGTAGQPPRGQRGDRGDGQGQAEIDGAFLYIPTVDQVDRALVEVPSSRFYDGSDDIVNA